MRKSNKDPSSDIEKSNFNYSHSTRAHVAQFALQTRSLMNKNRKIR